MKIILFTQGLEIRFFNIYFTYIFEIIILIRVFMDITTERF